MIKPIDIIRENLKKLFYEKPNKKVRKELQEKVFKQLDMVESDLPFPFNPYDQEFHENMMKLHKCIRLAKIMKIDLYKLEELGLQRYNAQYGSRGNFVTDIFYEELIKAGLLDFERRQE